MMVIKQRNLKSTSKTLKERPISDRDRAWLQKIFLRQDVSKMPKTVFIKLMSKNLIKVALTDDGRKLGCIEAIRALKI